MSSPLYLMPPLPVKEELFRQLLTDRHNVELFVGSTGEPVLALVLGEKHLDIQNARLIEGLLQSVARHHMDHQGIVNFSLIQGIKLSRSFFKLQSNLSVDLDRYEIQFGSQHIPLRAREAELLRILLRQPGRYVKAEILAEAIGSEGSEAPEHPVEEMISNLRRKLGETPHHPKLIRCKRYAGYAIFPEASAS